jgi:serine/threonine/tyrosine-interacting protein
MCEQHSPLVLEKPMLNAYLEPLSFRVCIRDAKEAFSVKPRFPDHFQYMTLDVEDNEEQNLIRLFPG